MIALLLQGCGVGSGQLAPPMQVASEASPEAEEVGGFGSIARGPGAAPAKDEDGSVEGMKKGGRAVAQVVEVVDALPSDDGVLREQKPQDAGPAAEAPIRQWFPESFLWRPSLQTDAAGLATVPVRVPDQLTTWRVLALAHDGNGHQAGAEHRFDSVLPLSVDPLVPGWAYVGDAFGVSARASSLTASASGQVRLQADGALDGSGSGAVQLTPGGSRLVRAPIRATRSGQGTVLAELYAPDRVDGAERQVEVRPRGRRIDTTRGGTLPRTLTLENRSATEQRVSVRVFPGPLSLFQAELDRIADAPAGTSYAVLQGVTALSRSAGLELDEPRLRSIRLRAWQRLVKQARSPSPAEAVRLLHGLGTPDDPLAQTLRDRLVRTAIEGQRGDGSWSELERSTVQRILVETAAGVRVLPEDREGPRLRAAGALERLVPMVDDPFTAAWVLASGVVDDGFREALEAQVLAGITEIDGVHVLKVPARVVDAAGRPPTRAQALAVAVLALQAREDLAWRGDLVSELLQQWSATRGFGSGWADAVALDALRVAMPALDQQVTVELKRDGQTLASGGLDPKQPAVPVLLQATGGGAFTVTSQPPLPGLSFVLTHSAWVPFVGTERLPGVDVEVDLPSLTAGREGAIAMRIAGPSGARVEIEQGIPAGTKVEPLTGRLASQTILADRVRFETLPLGAGEVITVYIPVTPQYPGVMHTPPLVVRSAGDEVQIEPAVWRVAGEEGA